MAERELGSIEHHELAGHASSTHANLELLAVVITAVAALLTAWAAFQATKWNGVQADQTRQAFATGNAAARQTTIASSQRNIDATVFLEWLQAFRDDVASGRVNPAAEYVPDPTTESGFIVSRLRQDFRPAFDEWLSSHPMTNSSAPRTPFELPSYKVAAQDEADRLTDLAAVSGAAATNAHHHAEEYVQMTVLFAVALVFSGVAGRLRSALPSTVALGFAALILGVAMVALLTYPVRW